MEKKRLKITVLVPAYNEERNVVRLHEALSGLADGTLPLPVADLAAGAEPLPDMTRYDWEFLFVNDGSRDNTLAALNRLRQRDPRVTVVDLARNFGKENALLAGFDHASGDAVVVMDADLQHPVETIPQMVYWWSLGYADVYGRRLSRGREPWLRRKATAVYYRLLQRLTDVEMMPGVGDFRLLDRRAVNALVSMRETQRYTKGMFSWIGGSKHAVDFYTADRTDGKSSFGLRRLVGLALNGILGFTTAPLRLASVTGIALSAVSLAYLVYALVKYLAWGDPVRGFATLLCVMLLIGGIELLCLGIIGEYVGRTFIESKRRPPYIVDTVNGKSIDN